jgi:hypothetical protein
MSLREHLQDGTGRWGVTGVVAAGVFFALWRGWPSDAAAQKSLVEGVQKIAFVAAAFAVTGYNLRTRVVDLILKIEGQPDRVEQFCRVARLAGQRLTNLVVLFTITAAAMGSTALFPANTLTAKVSVVLAVGLFAVSAVAFFYILFAFERLERMALDEAEENARRKEAMRLFKTERPAVV